MTESMASNTTTDSEADLTPSDQSMLSSIASSSASDLCRLVTMFFAVYLRFGDLESTYWRKKEWCVDQRDLLKDFLIA